MSGGAWGTCSVCGKPTRPDNASGLCWRCQQAKKSGRTCACGCGAPVGSRSRSGYTARCRLRAIALGLLRPQQT